MLCMYNVYMRMQAIGIHVYSLGENFAKLILSFHIYVSSRYKTYVSRLQLMSHLASTVIPQNIFSRKDKTKLKTKSINPSGAAQFSMTLLWCLDDKWQQASKVGATKCLHQSFAESNIKLNLKYNNLFFTFKLYEKINTFNFKRSLAFPICPMFYLSVATQKQIHIKYLSQFPTN